MEVPQSRPTGGRINRLALRTAAATAGAAALAAGAALLATSAQPWTVALVVGLAAGLGAGVAAYAAVHALVVRRLRLARDTLREARKGHFESLAQLQAGRRRDELDELLWQVYRAGRVLQQEIERLERLENHRREFLGNVSHELRTPIFVIAGFAEQLLDGALEDARVNRRFVEKIARNAERLDNLSRDLLAISKIESGEQAMTLAPFRLQGLAAEVVEALESVAERASVQLRLAIPPDLPPLLGDVEQLRPVLANLVDNAIKYNNPGGFVEVAARAADGEVRVEVRDDGLGIPPEAIPRLTERFFRVDRSRSRQQGGTGLGLAIVKHVLEAHGQRLHVESRPGAGATFWFRLPVAPAPPAATPPRTRARQPEA